MNLFWQITAVEALLNVAIFAVAVIAYGIVREQAAGCAGYLVSFPGRRGVYIGRAGDMHTEHFPR